MQPGISASRWGGGSVAVAAAEPSLRQLVEHHAAEHNIEFLPKVGRRHEGLQARPLHPSPSPVPSYVCYQGVLTLACPGAITSCW